MIKLFKLAVLLFVSICICIASVSAENKIKIGVTLSLSGNLAVWGQALQNGIVLADELYDTENKVEFIFEDDGFVAKNTVAAVKKLIDEDKVDALMVFGSGTSLAAGPIAEENKVPMIAFATDPAVVKDKNFILKHLPSVKTETAAVVEEVAKRNYESLAIITTAQEGVLALRNEFLKYNKVPVVFNEEVLPSETDFKSLAAKISASKASAVYMLLLPPQGGVFARQLRDSAFGGEIFAAHPTEDLKEVESSRGALLGSWLVSLNVIEDESFSLKYQDKFKVAPANYAVNGFDVAKIYIEGAGTKSLIEYLKNLHDFKGAMGTYSVTKDNDFSIPVQIKTITKDGFIKLSSQNNS